MARKKRDFWLVKLSHSDYWYMKVSGVRNPVSTRETDEAAAMEVAEELYAENYFSKKRTTFAHFTKRFFIPGECQYLKYRKGRRDGIPGDHHLHNCRRQLDNYLLPEFGRYKLNDIKTHHIDNYIVNLDNLSNETRNKLLSVMRTIMSEAKRLDLITANPVLDVKRFKHIPVRETRALTHDEENALFPDDESAGIKIWGKRWYFFFYLKLYTGMRKGEILALDWNQIDFDKRRIHIAQAIAFKDKIKLPKNGKARTIPMSTKVYDLLLKHKDDMRKNDIVSLYVFPNRQLNRIDRNEPNRVFRRVLNKLGLYTKGSGLCPHSLRHTRNTRFVELGWKSELIQAFMGHSSKEMTAHYYHETDKNREATLRTMLELVNAAG